MRVGQAAGNNSQTDGIEYATWRNVYDGHRAIFDASVKDPLVHTRTTLDWSALGRVGDEVALTVVYVPCSLASG